MPELPTDKKDREFELIDRILSGYHEGFYELIAPYERRVFMTAYDILQVEADAEEVAQEAFLKAFRSLRSFRREAQFSTWLLRITVNEARMRLRKRSPTTRRPSILRSFWQIGGRSPPKRFSAKKLAGYSANALRLCRKTTAKSLHSEISTV